MLHGRSMHYVMLLYCFYPKNGVKVYLLCNFTQTLGKNTQYTIDSLPGLVDKAGDLLSKVLGSISANVQILADTIS